ATPFNTIMHPTSLRDALPIYGGITAKDAEAARRQFAESPAVLLAGPGLGGSAKRLLPVLLCAPWRAAVLDADALNALAAGTPGRLPPEIGRASCRERG